MKRLFSIVILFTGFLLDSCSQLSFGTPKQPAVTKFSYQAVYLTNGPGELSAADIQSHPEVIATLTFDDFKSYAGSRIALWVDKNAVNMIDKEWLNLPPQKYYPLVLIGYNDPLYCFRDVLSVGRIQGPYVDWSKENLEPGFCVWMILVENASRESSRFRGYNQIPAVQDVLDITNPLLEEKQDIQLSK